MSIGALALVVAAPRAARAAEPSAPIDVTVRGSSAPGFVSRTSADDRAREPIDAASMLAELPSVHVRRLGADGSQALLSIRGSASSQVGVLFAGIPLSSGADPSFDVGSLPLWPGATFRVYRGFAPASLGTTGHIGGLVVVDPPSPRTGTRTEAQLVAGSFGAMKARAGAAHALGDLKLGIGVFGARADNDFSFQVVDPLRRELVTRTRTNAGYVSAGAAMRASLERSWGSIGATLLADARRTGLPGSTTFATKSARLEASRVVGGVDATVRVGKQGTLRALAFGRSESTLFADPRGEIGATQSVSLTEQGILVAGGSLGFRASPHRLVGLGVFLDARAEELDSSRKDGSIGSASRLAAGLGVELDVRPAERLRLFASGRLDGRRDHAEGFDAPASSLDLVPSGHVGASLRLADFAIITAHAGSLRRYPSFVELYGDRGSLVGDPHLRVERALSADLGLAGDLDGGGVVFRYELVGFVTSASDLIMFLPLGRNDFRASNIDAALVTGAEVSASLVARSLVTTVSYTLLATENRSADPLSFGRPLPGRPLHDLSYDAAFVFGPVRLRYGIDAVAGTTVDTGGTQVVPPRFFHGAGLALDVPRFSRLRLGLEVQNLFDVRTFNVFAPLLGTSVALPVADFLGFPLPGRTFWATARFRAP